MNGNVHDEDKRTDSKYLLALHRVNRALSINGVRKIFGFDATHCKIKMNFKHFKLRHKQMNIIYRNSPAIEESFLFQKSYIQSSYSNDTGSYFEQLEGHYHQNDLNEKNKLLSQTRY